MYSYYYRQNGWEPILQSLRQSLYAEEMVCAMSSELLHIPETKNLKGNNEMHSHLVPASYHRVTSVGSAQRLVNGENRKSIIDTMVACIINAETQDKGVREGLSVMEANANQELKSYIRLIIRWQEQAESSLQAAKQAVQAMGISLPSQSEAHEGYEY
ncbi:hypothetical protein GCM10008967_20390 [Bacillus carboniphilus]|uniref:Uncharacterized protein n=1 Tax=Bacillus carboniphilus TaxID=86663 RepID=A0ABN0W9H2_9BACI